jgi:hypothetical protein
LFHGLRSFHHLIILKALRRLGRKKAGTTDACSKVRLSHRIGEYQSFPLFALGKFPHIKIKISSCLPQMGIAIPPTLRTITRKSA